MFLHMFGLAWKTTFLCVILTLNASIMHQPYIYLFIGCIVIYQFICLSAHHHYIDLYIKVLIIDIYLLQLLSGCSVTVGHDAEEDGKWPYAGTAAAVQTMGARHVVKDLNEALVDEENLVVTTPAFMCNAKVHEVYDSVGAMITALVGLLRK